MEQITIMKCCLNKHKYFNDIITSKDDLIKIIETIPYTKSDTDNQTYIKLLLSFIDPIYLEFQRQYEFTPILRVITFIRDISLMFRKLEQKIKFMIFADNSIDWDNPELMDFIRLNISQTQSNGNTTPFMDAINSSEMWNHDTQEKTDSKSYSVSKQSLSQRLQAQNWNETIVTIVKSFQTLFWKITPFCDFEEVNYA